MDSVGEALLGPVAGSGATLSWPLIMLASHPKVQEKLRTLIDETLKGLIPSLSELMIADDLSLDNISNKPIAFLDYVIKESQRLHPIFTTTVPEITVNDMELHGYHIPAGVDLFLIETHSVD